MHNDAPDLHFDGARGTLERPIVETRAVEITCAPVAGAVTAALVVGSDELGQPLARLGASEWRWEWQPRGRVGTFAVHLTVERQNATTSSWTYALVVAPTKLEQQHYLLLLDAIQRTATGLVYALGGGATGMTTSQQAVGPESLLATYWTRLRVEVDLAHAITQSLVRQHQPASRLVRERRDLAELLDAPMAALARATEGDIDELDAAIGAPLDRLLPRSAAGKSQVPRSLPVTTSVATRDVYEHRLLLRLIDELDWRCRFVGLELAREIAWRSRSSLLPADTQVEELKEWHDQIRAAGRLLDRCRSVDFLHGVTPLAEWKGPSERMRRDPRYRKIGELWRMLHGQPFVALQSPAFDLPVNDLPALYEQWCLLEVAATLASMGTLIEQQLLEAEDADATHARHAVWRIRLLQHRPLLRVRCADGAELELAYQRRFLPHEGHTQQLGSLDPFLRVPDIVIGLTRPGQAPALLVLDAKYRVAPNGGIPEEALGDAYTYHAALGWAGRRVSRGAFLLFPGDHGFVQDAIGALPLVPGATGAIRTLIEQVLIQTV